MIGVIGGNNITLRRLCVSAGFSVPNSAYRHHYDGIFNASFTTAQLLERVPHWVRELPMINKSLVTNKLTALRKVEVYGYGDHVPQFSLDPRHEGTWIEKPYFSQAGRGVQRYSNGAPIPYGKYIQRDIIKFREFRAHVGLWLDDPVFTIQEKKPKPEMWDRVFDNCVEYHWPVDRFEWRNSLPVTWNIESGFYFKRLTDHENRAEKRDRFPLIGRIEDLGIAVVKALGYHYGAVDILMNEDRELFVVECNSHPAIKNPRSQEIYTWALTQLLGLSGLEFRNLVEGEATTTHSMTRTY